MANTMFSENNIQVIEQAPNWPTAVKQASQPLIASGAITTQYIDNMIASVKQNGPYMVLADYFALMHARPGIGVNQMGMSLLVSRKPVDLAGKPVKIFLIMAAMDNTSHLKSLQKIMSVFMDEKAYQTVLAGHKQEIITLFKSMGVTQ